eukprot:CAMPEP_0119357198 /NCGR_PEP_ID=MMETSP1334-20130426/5634_1 /TAXON_ID=127549 /ORGANISM="Calcidiscus leptoporus, Strain RCC1130" /LENGTH=46 /DNA_ID= /DNA_START= /DNA_END= /DNA_ORIENTATION=
MGDADATLHVLGTQVPLSPLLVVPVTSRSRPGRVPATSRSRPGHVP